MHAGHDIEDRNSSTEWLAIGATGQTHQTRNCLNDEVVTRKPSASLGAEATDREVDQARIVIFDIVVAQPKLFDSTWLEIFEGDVGSLEQRPRDLKIISIFEVEDE